MPGVPLGSGAADRLSLVATRSPRDHDIRSVHEDPAVVDTLPSCGGAVTASRHVSIIFVTPPPAPRCLPESAAPGRAWNHGPAEERGIPLTTERPAHGHAVACR